MPMSAVVGTRGMQSMHGHRKHLDDCLILDMALSGIEPHAGQPCSACLSHDNAAH